MYNYNFNENTWKRIFIHNLVSSQYNDQLNPSVSEGCFYWKRRRGLFRLEKNVTWITGSHFVLGVDFLFGCCVFDLLNTFILL